MLELLEQYQRLEIVLKLSRGRRKKAEQGGHADGGAAFGNHSAKGQKILYIDPAQANTVRRVFELRYQFLTWTLNNPRGELIPDSLLPQTEESVSPADRVASLLRRNSNNVCSLLKAEKIIQLVKADGIASRQYQEQRNFLIQSIVRDIRFKRAEVTKIEAQMRDMLNQVEYKLESMPCISLVTACGFVSEIRDITRFATADKLARFAGIAPTVYGSGERGGKGDRRQKCQQGNRALHELFYQLAVQQVHKHKSGTKRNPVMYAYYKQKTKEGKTNGQVMVCVMRRLVNIIYGMMKTKTAYILPTLQESRVS